MVASIPPILYFSGAGALIGLMGLGVVLWLVFGQGPKRGRAYRRARRRLHAGDWQAALSSARHWQEGRKLSAIWSGRLRNLEGEALKRGGDEALKSEQFEDALERHTAAAEFLGLDGEEMRNLVIERMLSEARRRFSASQDGDGSDVEKLLRRLIAMQADCAEAHFWLGLSEVRAGQMDRAVEALAKATALSGKRFIDPPLYHGALLLKQGQAQQALRSLGEANRVDANCPFVAWQLGAALVASGGDANLALRALLRATSPRGLAQWTATPDRAWVDGFPEGASFVRRLAAKHVYRCPVFGADVAAIVRQATLAVARAYMRLGNYADAAQVFQQLLGESPPTPVLLQGLGMALALQEQYDDAFKHLRLALEQENPKTHETGGYLALCGALGKPSRPEDKPRNVLWAIRLLSRFDVTGDAEWARINNRVFAEARSAGLGVPLDDQLRLMKVLLGAQASDPLTAQAILHLATAHPQAVELEHAAVYCHIAQQHGLSYAGDVRLFSILLRDESRARALYAERGWDLDEVAYLYLERSAASAPGLFPADLGTDFPPRGEKLLMERSRRLLASGNKEQALAAAVVLARLAPESADAFDWLGQVQSRSGNAADAIAALRQVQNLRPQDPTPLVREAILHQEMGAIEAMRQAIGRALGITTGTAHGGAALLGARLLLRTAAARPEAGLSPENLKLLQDAANLLQQCLEVDPNNVNACWLLAAVRALNGEREALIALAPKMARPDVSDARFQFMAAAVQLVAGNWISACDAAQRAATETALAGDANYLHGLALLHLNQRDTARACLERAATTANSPSTDHARAILGNLEFAAGRYDSAIQRWQAVAKPTQTSWKLDEPLRSTIYLTALQAFGDERFEIASERFREAGKQGLRERRLGPLISLALVRAGEKLLFANDDVMGTVGAHGEER